MKNAHDAAQRVGITEPRGDTNVARRASGKRVLAFVESTAIEGKANRLHDFDCQLALFGRSKLTGDLEWRTTRLQLDDFLNEAGKPTTEGREDDVDLCAGQSRTEF